MSSRVWRGYKVLQSRSRRPVAVQGGLPNQMCKESGCSMDDVYMCGGHTTDTMHLPHESSVQKCRHIIRAQ